MPQARRNGVGELLESAAKMPWWGGILLAFLAFIMLHPFAIMEVAHAAPIDDYPEAFASKAFWRSLAATVQYVVPAVLLFAPALASVLHRVLRGRGT